MIMIITHFNLELIDTLWNVNEQVFARALRMADELIDTLWNVN